MKTRALALAVVLVLSDAPLWAVDAPEKPTVIPPLEKIERPASDTGENTGPTSPSRVLPGERPVHKNYWLPALEIPLFIAGWNQIARRMYDSNDFDSTLSIGWRHVRRGPWRVDRDAFDINQIGHPYQGTIYYGIARSCGLNFWESLLYTNVGSYIWETYGETTDPSINDQVASGTAGALFGEPLFRMASMVLEGGDEKPGFWRELGAAFISPPAQVNRHLFGHDYGPLIEHRRPAYHWQVRGGFGRNVTIRAPGSTRKIDREIGAAAFSMEYGLPGNPGYRYLRPFDYFRFDLDGTMGASKSFQNLMIRGLLFGKRYESGESFRGVWGLYGTYDYLSPQAFRLSTTAAQFGTTLQKWLSPGVALQGTGLIGAGYGAAGTVLAAEDQGDFHYGLAPQALLNGRVVFGRRWMWETTARAYHITQIGSNRAPGTERIARVETGVVYCVYERHHLGVHYWVTRRQARYRDDRFRRDQLVDTLVFAYTFASDLNFGLVRWGPWRTED